MSVSKGWEKLRVIIFTFIGDDRIWLILLKSKGFAFVEMTDDAAAKKAIEELNGAEFDGRAMVVKEAKPRV